MDITSFRVAQILRLSGTYLERQTPHRGVMPSVFPPSQRNDRRGTPSMISVQWVAKPALADVFGKQPGDQRELPLMLS